jgi:hypothetical protein
MFGLADEMQTLAQEFLSRYFGAHVLTQRVVKARFDHDSNYRFIAMIGKQQEPAPETIVWIALQRHGRDSNERVSD